jgi:hypothetical protein
MGSLYVVVGGSELILLLTAMAERRYTTVSGTKIGALLDVAYGGGVFVAVGVNGTVLYGRHGTVWQASGAVSYTNINAVIYRWQ